MMNVGDQSFKQLTYLFRASNDSRPILLLGAGASFRAGIPLAEEALRRMARASYAINVKGMDWRHCNVLPDDWMPYLSRQPWFLPNAEQLAENFPLAAEHFLNPQEIRRQFFMDLIEPVNGINSGYKDLASLMLRRLCWTVLTTNFDRLIVEALREFQPHLPALVEINRTSDDLVRFKINNRLQVVYLHGAVEFYRDRNLIEETQRLDSNLVSRLRPLLSSSPLIVIGYRGSEPSVMHHLLDEGFEECAGYPHGIFWCTRESDTLHSNVVELQAKVGRNFRLVEIQGFDELMKEINSELSSEVAYTSAGLPLPPEGQRQPATPFEQELVMDATFEDIDRELALVTLIRYCKEIGLPVIDQSSLIPFMLELGLLVKGDEGIIPTNASYLLFGKDASERFPYAKISFTNQGKKRVVFEGNLLTQFRDLVGHLTASEVNPILRIKSERGSDERSAYPTRSITEVSVNMIVHRDYSLSDYSRIEFQPGRQLRFINPGGLLDKVREKLSIENDGPFEPVRTVTELRNPRLAAVFYGLRSMDKAGSGMIDVRDLMSEHGGNAEFAILNNNSQLSATLLQPLQSAPESDRVARRLSNLELYTTNLLPLAVVPEVIWRLPLRPKPLVETPLFDRDELPLKLPLFLKHSNELISFADLSRYPDFAERRGYLDRLRSESLPRFLGNKDNRNLFVWLLGKHWSFFLLRWKDQGLVVEHKKRRAYFKLVEGTRNRIIYNSRARKGVRRDVVKRRERGEFVEHENEGIYYSIVEYGGNWAIQIRPFYMFTREDGLTSIPSFLVTRRATRRMKFDRNKNVDDDLTFWARYLSQGQETLNLGGVGVDDLILDFEYSSAEVPLSKREVEADEN